MTIDDPIYSVVIDDEQAARATLKNMLGKYCPEVHMMGEAGSVSEGVSLVKRVKPQLIFLDIEMPSGTGFDLLEQIGGLRCDVVFTTAHSHYAIPAIKIFALDYLLKPIDRQELIDAVKKVRRSETAPTANVLDLLREQFLHRDPYPRRLAIPSATGLDIIKVDDILYCEGDRNYTIFHVAGNERLMASKTLKEYESVLSPHTFVRVHQKYLININYVKRYVKGRGGTLIMSDGKSIEVSHNKKAVLMDVLK